MDREKQMSAQDKTEKVLRELHVLVSKSETYEEDPDKIIVDKKQMVDLLKELAVCMTEIMDEYDLNEQSREKAEREHKKIGEEIINDAKRKAEDVYAGSVLYTDEALKRVLDIMQEANDSVKKVFSQIEEQLDKERQYVIEDKSELKGHLQDLKDTDKYMSIIEERNKKIAKEKKWKEDGLESVSRFTSAKPEIKVNKDYFEQHGLSLEEDDEPVPEEKTEKAAPQINVNLDSEYFKWKEKGEETEVPDIKQPEKKTIFGKFMK